MGQLIMNPIGGRDLTAFAYEDITVSSTALGFTTATIAPTTYGPAHRAFVTVETDQIRWTCDGTTPTSVKGHLAEVGDYIEIEGIANIKAFRAIRVTADSTLRVSYSRFKMGA